MESAWGNLGALLAATGKIRFSEWLFLNGWLGGKFRFGKTVFVVYRKNCILQNTVKQKIVVDKYNKVCYNITIEINGGNQNEKVFV